MGRRGPVPQSREERLAKGNPGNRPLPDYEPPITVVIPDPPAYLSREACVEWRRVAQELADLERICGLDRAMLAIYCETWADLVRCREGMAEVLAEKGTLVVETAAGQVYDHPLIKRCGALQKQCVQYLSQLGMSPISRARLPPSKRAEGDASRGRDSLARYAEDRPLE